MLAMVHVIYGYDNVIEEFAGSRRRDVGWTWLDARLSRQQMKRCRLDMAGRTVEQAAGEEMSAGHGWTHG